VLAFIHPSAAARLQADSTLSSWPLYPENGVPSQCVVLKKIRPHSVFQELFSRFLFVEMRIESESMGQREILYLGCFEV
jgi:hypothetical protein